MRNKNDGQTKFPSSVVALTGLEGRQFGGIQRRDAVKARRI